MKRIEIGTRVGTPDGPGVVVTRENFVQGRGVICDKNPLPPIFGMYRWGVQLDTPPREAFPQPAYYHPDKVWRPRA